MILSRKHSGVYNRNAFYLQQMTGPEFNAILTRHRNEFSPVVPFDPSKDSIMELDLSEGNSFWPAEILHDTKEFTARINLLLEKSSARYAIGGYSELRSMYQMSRVFDATEPADEPLEPCLRFHGFFVAPPNQRLSYASAPNDSLAHNTAPAFLNCV